MPRIPKSQPNSRKSAKKDTQFAKRNPTAKSGSHSKRTPKSVASTIPKKSKSKLLPSQPMKNLPTRDPRGVRTQQSSTSKPQIMVNADSTIFSAYITKPMSGERVDIALVNLFDQFSRRQIRQYIDSGMVFLNKKRIWIAKYVIETGDLLEINTVLGDKQKVEFDAKNILFENDNFLIVNKPAGMIVEDSKHNYPIFKAIKALSVEPSDEELFIVHRIDKETSGLIIIAKKEAVQRDLVELWSAKKVQKIYQCICLNVPSKMQGSIDSNIGQHAGRNQYGINKRREEGGKTALTLFKVNAVLQKGIACIFSCEPKTGRSHQIRVHLASLDCPILGDKIYGSKFKMNPLYMIANRQMLHASQLIFELYGAKYNFHAPVPSDFNQMVKYIKTSKQLTETAQVNQFVPKLATKRKK